MGLETVNFPIHEVHEGPIQAILVPRGAEYQAVRKGLSQISDALPMLPDVLPIPIGPKPVKALLSQLDLQPGGYLLMGLGGSLSPKLQQGDVVLGQRCLWARDGTVVAQYDCDRNLATWIYRRLRSQVQIGTMVSCDRIAATADAKAELHQLTQADVVEMEGSAVLEVLAPHPVAILRVISDKHDQDLPDLASAVDADGNLKPLPMALSFLKQPIAAVHLIRGSLQGLKQLQTITTQLFSPSSLQSDVSVF